MENSNNFFCDLYYEDHSGKNVGIYCFSRGIQLVFIVWVARVSVNAL